MKMNLNRKLNKGFTLIELLVVVAIIGILASVVLASLTSARSKGKDAAIFAQLSSIRAQAELYNSSAGNYGTNSVLPAVNACGGTSTGGTMFTNTATGTPPGLATLLTGIGNTLNGNGALAQTTDAVCNYGPITGTSGTSVTNTAWAVAVRGASANTYYCVDSTGTSKSYIGSGFTAVIGASGAGAIASATATVCN